MPKKPQMPMKTVMAPKPQVPPKKGGGKAGPKTGKC